MGDIIVKVLLAALILGCIIWSIWFENKPDDKPNNEDEEK